MTDHVGDLLPFFVNDTVAARDRQRIVSHLAACERCRAELADWTQIAMAVQWGAPDPVTGDVTTRTTSAGNRAWMLMQSQLPRLPVSLLVAFLVAALATGGATRLTGQPWFVAVFVWCLGPLLAGGTVAALVDPQEGGLSELMGTLPTSPRTVLLTRVGLVAGLFTATMGVVAAIVAPESLVPLLLAWLGPVAVLSAVGLAGAVLIRRGIGQAAVGVFALLIGIGHLGLVHPSGGGALWLRAASTLVSWPWGAVVAGLLFGLAFVRYSRSPLTMTA
jgi:hypothetical protein